METKEGKKRSSIEKIALGVVVAALLFQGYTMNTLNHNMTVLRENQKIAVVSAEQFDKLTFEVTSMKKEVRKMTEEMAGLQSQLDETKKEVNKMQQAMKVLGVDFQ